MLVFCDADSRQVNCFFLVNQVRCLVTCPLRVFQGIAHPVNATAVRLLALALPILLCRCLKELFVYMCKKTISAKQAHRILPILTAVFNSEMFHVGKNVWSFFPLPPFCSHWLCLEEEKADSVFSSVTVFLARILSSQCTGDLSASDCLTLVYVLGFTRNLWSL